MNIENQSSDETKAGVWLDENAACDVCGRFGAFRFGERTLCQDCYESCGSCCPEFGKDNLSNFSDGC